MIETLEDRLRAYRQQLYQTPQASSWAPPAARPSSDLSTLSAASGESEPTTPVRSRQSSGGKLIAVGDSLGVGTTPYLKTSGSDTKVGRSSASAVDALKALVKAGSPSDVLFDAGTNDATAGQLADSIRRASKVAKGATIYVPTVNGPQAQAKNRVIRQLGAEGLINVIDWAGRSKGLVGSDGIHASAQGYKTRARLIRQALGAG